MWIPNRTAACIEMRASDIFESVSSLLLSIKGSHATRSLAFKTTPQSI